VPAQQVFDQGLVADIPVDESVAPRAGQLDQVVLAAGVRQEVQGDDPAGGCRAQRLANEMRPDETGAAGDQETSHAGRCLAETCERRASIQGEDDGGKRSGGMARWSTKATRSVYYRHGQLPASSELAGS